MDKRISCFVPQPPHVVSTGTGTSQSDEECCWEALVKTALLGTVQYLHFLQYVKKNIEAEQYVYIYNYARLNSQLRTFSASRSGSIIRRSVVL